MCKMTEKVAHCPDCPLTKKQSFCFLCSLFLSFFKLCGPTVKKNKSIEISSVDSEKSETFLQLLLLWCSMNEYGGFQACLLLNLLTKKE